MTSTERSHRRKPRRGRTGTLPAIHTGRFPPPGPPGPRSGGSSATRADGRRFSVTRATAYGFSLPDGRFRYRACRVARTRRDPRADHCGIRWDNGPAQAVPRRRRDRRHARYRRGSLGAQQAQQARQTSVQRPRGHHRPRSRAGRQHGAARLRLRGSRAQRAAARPARRRRRAPPGHAEGRLAAGGRQAAGPVVRRAAPLPTAEPVPVAGRAPEDAGLRPQRGRRPPRLEPALPAPGAYDFTGVRDLDLFLRTAAECGLYVVLHPGPHIGADVDAGACPAG